MSQIPKLWDSNIKGCKEIFYPLILYKQITETLKELPDFQSFPSEKLSKEIVKGNINFMVFIVTGNRHKW
jgi:hypothetical protein